MRARIALLVVGLATTTAGPAADGLHGVQVGDIDSKVEPCNDFFGYANGAWRASNPIPSYMDRWSRRWASGETNKDQLEEILTEVSQRTDATPGSVEQLTGDYYAACMDMAAVDAAGAKPVQPMLDQIAAIETRADVQRNLERLSALGIAAPFQIVSFPDLHEPTNVIADLGAAGLGLPDRDYYVKTEKRFVEARARYLAHVANMLRLAGANADDAKAAATAIFAFEKRLAEVSLDNVALRDPKSIDHKTTFAELQKMAPAFDWGAYFDALKLPRIPINVEQPKFVAEVDRALRETAIDDWKLYLRWQLLRAAAGALSQPFIDEAFDFNGRYLAGATENKPRWKQCVESTDQLLGEALGQEYVKRHFPPAAKARMQDMVQDILYAMGDTIKHLEWMGDDTKRKALEKLSTFNPKIGYPDQWKDYSAIKLGRSSNWDNNVAALRWNVADDLSTVGKPVDRGRWGMTPPTSNAYYNPLLNEIVFPAGILQSPAFDLAATDAVNYGAIGVVIGHEVSHGFDDQGAQFDAQGRLKNWWTADDLESFGKRGQCVVEQFDGYTIEPGVHHNGKLVLGESIGDLAGAKLAFKAYQHSREGKPPEPTLDGFTPEQQFFIAWGQWRGDETRMETQRLMIQGDPHPVAKYRVNGPLANLPAFQAAFSCKADAPMVRAGEQRCEVW